MPGPRFAALLALLALAPMAVYLLDRGEAMIVSLSVVSVVIIAASLYLMFGPAEGAEPGAPAGP